ncbi:hypothetical protein THAOC_18263, partial [Thalassiosira oceanica]
MKTGFFSLLLAASSASAFRPHSDTSRRQFLGGVASTASTGIADRYQGDDLESRINEVLTKRSQELLDELGDEQTAREALLSSRLPGLNFLDRSEVRPSDIPGAGRGLFAIEDVHCGQ